MNPPGRETRDDLAEEARERFGAIVDSVGVAQFARSLGLSTRQVNRIRSGAQPNPIERLLRCLQACPPETGDEILAWLCQEAGGFFVRAAETLDDAAVSAVRESAEAIVAISDGKISRVDEREIREAIAALIALLVHVLDARRAADSDQLEIVVPTHNHINVAKRQSQR